MTDFEYPRGAASMKSNTALNNWWWRDAISIGRR